MSLNNNPKVPDNVRAEASFIRAIKNAVNNLIDGKVNCLGEYTLTNGATTTTVKNELCTPDKTISPMPQTSQAAAATGIWIEPQDKQFVVHHADPGNTNAKFRYVMFG
jgi:hypothetical protein